MQRIENLEGTEFIDFDGNVCDCEDDAMRFYTEREAEEFYDSLSLKEGEWFISEI